MLNWATFSKRNDIKVLPLSEQKKRFAWEQQRLAEQNWFLEQQIVAGNAGSVGSVGVAADGPLNGATVTARGVSVTTNALGEFTFPFTLDSADEVTVTGGIDSITGLPYEGELKGYITDTIKVICPVTTLAFYDPSAESYNAAIDNVISIAESYGFTGITKETLVGDYVKKSIEENNAGAVAMQSFTTYIDSLAEASATAIVGLPTATYGIPATVKQAKTVIYRYFADMSDIYVGDFAISEVTNPSTTIQELFDGINFTIESTLLTELIAVCVDVIADSNYKTTRIQSINRTIKNTYKSQINSAKAASDSKLFIVDINDINDSITNEGSSLARIETIKSNATTRTTDPTKTTNLISLVDYYDSRVSLYNSIDRIPIGTSTLQNLYAFSTTLTVGSKLFAYDPAQKNYHLLSDESVIIEGRKFGAWTLVNSNRTPLSDKGYAIITDLDGYQYHLDYTGIVVQIIPPKLGK